MTDKKYLNKCLKFLDFFGVDYTKDKIKLSDGGHSCIMNPDGKFYKDFAGKTINEVAEYVAKEFNKETEWID